MIIKMWQQKIMKPDLKDLFVKYITFSKNA